jgi:zinc protease
MVQIDPDAKVHEFRFDNGMRLFVQEDHRAPVVVSQIWYAVGSSYEHDGITGISHLLEHMMFKATDELEAGEFSRIISRNGGRENAFTSRDYTAYFQQLAADRLEISFRWEADRMRDLRFDPEELKKEAAVVREERRLRTEDKPTAKTYERFNATAFLTSPQRIPVIGWMEDLEQLNVADLQAWYRAWYAPNNATLVVVGDVDPAEVYALAQKHFAGLSAEALVKPKTRSELPQTGTRRIEVKAVAQVPYLVMGYKTPTLKSAEAPWEAYALEVLAGVLDGGSSSRFSSDLVREQRVAASAGAGYDLHARLEGMFTIDGTPANGRTVVELEQALRAQIERVRNEPPTEAELDRVKAQVVAAEVFERDSVFYQAMKIGMMETMGLGWRVLDEYADGVRAVTPQQVLAVARKYLVDDTLTIAELVPQQAEEKREVRHAQ